MTQLGELLEEISSSASTKILYLIMDGLGGLPAEGKPGSELDVARTPNLDKVCQVAECGLFDPVLPGITPGSGPGHLALFGYDPIDFNIGRGVLSALGIGFELTTRDVAARLNFATVDAKDLITDRRAGRLSTDENKRIVQKLKSKWKPPPGVEVFLETESEHRVVLILRGEDLGDAIKDTDPQKTGVRPLEARGADPASERTAAVVRNFMTEVRNILRDEPKGNMLLARGFAKYRPYPSMKERFKLKALAVAQYPMYRGLAKLVGMDLAAPYKDYNDGIELLKKHWADYDFFYFHVKKTDSYGEDGNFDAKVHVIEDVDVFVPKLLELKPDVFVVSADHSSPASMAGHSWHPVPVVIRSGFCRPGPVMKFCERELAKGTLGRQPLVHILTLAMGHARRLAKYGA